MKKKFLATMLTAAMTASLFAGCGSSSDGGSTSAETSGTESASGAEQTGETDHVIMTYLTLGETPADLQAVQDAINEISTKEINVEVELKPVAIPDAFSNYSLWIGSGEQIDLMCIAFQGINNYVTSGQLTPIDDLLASDGQYLKGLTEEAPITDGAVIDGVTYGVTPVSAAYGFRGGMIIREEYFDELGEEQKDEYTLDEIGDILAKIKENHPDCYPLAALGSGVGSTATAYGYVAEMDNLGATTASGAVLSADSTTIENVYKTEGYKNFLLTMRDWYEKGYIMPDAATTDATNTELMTTGKCCGYFMNAQPVQTANTEASYGFSTIALNITDGYFPSITSSGNTYWTIPITSANPSAAMKFLNLMYEDQDIADLLMVGIEGTHYVKTDEENVVAFPDGVTMDNTTYYNALGLYGDRRNEKTFSAGASKDVNDAWTANNEKKTYKSFGYNYNTANMSNQLIAVNSVLDQYLPALETGSVEDVEGTYETFINALDAAGIDEIIADNQAQFDEWLASQN